MSIFRFELKKWVNSYWVLIVLITSLLLGFGFYIWKEMAATYLLFNEIETLQTFNRQMVSEKNNLKNTEPERFIAVDSKQPSVFDKISTHLEAAEVGLNQRNSQEFMEEKLGYYRQLALHQEVIFQTPSDYSLMEKEDIYYLQQLVENEQAYENRAVSTFLPNFIYQLVTFLSHPIIFLFLLFICFIPMGREKESGTVHFMLGFSNSLRRYLAVSQVIHFMMATLGLMILILTACLLSQLKGTGLLDALQFDGQWIVDTSYIYQTVVHFSDVLIVFFLLSIPLITFYLQLFTWLNLYIQNTLLANIIFISVSLALGGWASKLTVIGNPFRFHDFQTFIYNQPSTIDLLLSVSFTLVISLLLFLFFSREAYRARVVRH